MRYEPKQFTSSVDIEALHMYLELEIMRDIFELLEVDTKEWYEMRERISNFANRFIAIFELDVYMILEKLKIPKNIRDTEGFIEYVVHMTNKYIHFVNGANPESKEYYEEVSRVC